MKVVDKSICNAYCVENPNRPKTYIISPFYRCLYHRILQSVSDRAASSHRPRLIKEIVKDNEIVVAVYIGQYGGYKVDDADLEYVVKAEYDLSSFQPLLLFDNRRKVWVRIEPEDAEVVISRIRYDLWLSQRNGEHVLVNRTKKQVPLIDIKLVEVPE